MTEAASPKDSNIVPLQREVDSQQAYSAKLLDCLLLVARTESRYTSEASVLSGLPVEGDDLPPELFVRAANRAGLAATLLERSLAEIPKEVLPAILILKNGDAAVLSDIDSNLGIAVITMPDSHDMQQVDITRLESEYSDHVFYLRPLQNFDSRTPKIYESTGEHWFWGVIKSSWGIYRDVLIASLVINLFVLAQPLFVMNVYDRVVPNNAMETLWALAIGVSIVYLFDWGLKALRSYFIEMAAKRTDVILSAQLFEKVLSAKLSFKPVSAGAFASRLQDFDVLRNFVTSSTILALIDLPFVLIFLIFLAYLGGWLVVIPLVFIPIAIFLSYRAQKQLRPVIENMMRSGAKKGATLIESLVGIEAVKYLGSEGQMQRTWEQSVGYMAQWGLKARTISNNTLTAIQFLQQLAMVTLVVWGVYLIAGQQLTMGGLIACVILNGRTLAPLSQIAGLLTSYNHAEGTLKSLNDIMALPVERESNRSYLHRPEFNGNIQLKGVDFAYPEQPMLALKGVNLQISAGEKVGIIGKIGSGKTTLAKLLLRLYEPTAGSVLVDGFDLQQLDIADIRSNIGYVSQDASLFFGTVRDNIAFGAGNVADEDVVAAASQAGILDFINAHPLGFQMPVGERGETLSGGQRSAIALARVFLRSPSVLIMDEPTAAMDQGSEEQIKQQVRNHFAKNTLILVTHKMGMLDLVDRLIVVDRGGIVADGPKQKVLEALKNGQVKGRV